jgi:hypothetical protein
MRPMFVGVVSVLTVVACRGQRSAPASAPLAAASPSVFTDSALHAKLCEPTKRDEDWRQVCVPKDQSQIIRLKPLTPRP